MNLVMGIDVAKGKVNEKKILLRNKTKQGLNY